MFAISNLFLNFDTKLWGSNCDSSLENVHMFACKQFLNVSYGVCTGDVRGDLGRFPMHIFAIKRCKVSKFQSLF